MNEFYLHLHASIANPRGPRSQQPATSQQQAIGPESHRANRSSPPRRRRRRRRSRSIYAGSARCRTGTRLGALGASASANRTVAAAVATDRAPGQGRAPPQGGDSCLTHCTPPHMFRGSPAREDDAGADHHHCCPPACARRLARDLREVQAEELSTIAAEPLADDVRIWRVTFTAPDGPYRGVPFHMVFNFPDSYPATPPRVQLCTRIPHPNVYAGYDFSSGRSEPGNWLCLNMLRDVSQGSYSGWSGAYSVCSILVQLQSFLFAESIDQDYGYSESSQGFCEHAAAAAMAFHERYGAGFPTIAAKISSNLNELDFDSRRPMKLSLGAVLSHKLGHCQQPAPAAPGTHMAPPAAATSVQLGDLPEDVLLRIADQLPPQSVSALFRTCRGTSATLARACVAVRRELHCFFSKVSFGEDVLGFGLHVVHGGYQRGCGGRHIKSVSTELELLSRGAFEIANVRTSVWKRPFEHWLPVLLNADHSSRALPLAKRRLMAIAGRPSTEAWDPLVALTVLPRLLNQMTVSLMSTADDSTSLHASEKALLGFTSFHHLLLRLAADYPIIRRRAMFWVGEFISSTAKRSKMVIHDLGEFLVLLYLCPPGTWNKLACAFIEESFVRNVRWILDPSHGDAGTLAVMEPRDSVSEYRLERTLNAAATSRRLLMFQAFFLLRVACPAGQAPDTILREYERRHGRPPPGTATRLQSVCRDILGPLSWRKFFNAMGVALPRKAALCNILRAAIVQSERRGYHCSASVDFAKLRIARIKQEADRGNCTDLLRDSPGAGSCTSSGGDSSSDVWSTEATTNDSPMSNKLFVGGLKPAHTADEIRQLCCSFGAPLAVEKAAGDRHAFVWFARADEAEAAMRYLSEVSVAGRQIRVQHSRNHGRRRQRNRPDQRNTVVASVAGTGHRCPYPALSLEAKRWYKDNGRY